ncbi:hypothetical protein [Candidatus Leptofilum sp.]|uniref:hypothetical protein n=1 Tax=Candidatus Leptofilum sp. TaxID=3241576 RepID=UPI003B5A314D
MNQTNLLNLRPLSVGELFDRAFRIYRNNFGIFLGIMLLTQIPIYLFNIVLTTVAETAPNLTVGSNFENLFGTAIIASIIALILSIIFFQIGSAALTKAVSDSYLGRKIGYWESFQRMGNSWATLIFASIVAGFIVFGLAIPVIILFFIPCIGPILGFIGAFIVGAIGNVLISLVTPVVVLERKGAIASVRRAWELAKHRFWWAFGYLFLLGLLSGLVILGPTAVIEFLFATILGDTSSFFQIIVEQTSNSLLSAVFMPIRLAAITLMYFDLRIRFEGFDLAVLSATDDPLLDDASEFTTWNSL